MHKIPNCRETDQLVIYMHDWGDELVSIEKQLQLNGQSGLIPTISGFQVQPPTLSASLPTYPKELRV